MTRDNPRELIAELRERAERPSTGSNTAQCMREAADALAVLSAPQEAKSVAKVVPVSYEASASCSHGVCPAGCSHLMWSCSSCSCEGGWGASREQLEKLAAKHECPPAPQEGDARERLHAKCDCVPDLGPAHCHLCGNEKGSPVPWPECPAVRAAAPEPEWEYICQTDKPTENHLTVFSESLERARRTQAQRKRMGHLSSRIWGRRKAGPWEPVGGDDGE